MFLPKSLLFLVVGLVMFPIFLRASELSQQRMAALSPMMMLRVEAAREEKESEWDVSHLQEREEEREPEREEIAPARARSRISDHGFAEEKGIPFSSGVFEEELIQIMDEWEQSPEARALLARYRSFDQHRLVQVSPIDVFTVGDLN